MNNRIFLHIGYPKTGTTFLQHGIFSSLEPIHYITQEEMWESGFLNEILLKDIFSYNEDKVFKILKQWKQKAGKTPLFISYEGFVGNLLNGGKNLPLIIERLNATDYDFKFLMTIRNQPRVIDSLYAQYVHQGGSLSFKYFINLNEKSPIYLPFHLFDYNKMFEYWISHFGAKNLVVLHYECINTKVEFLSYLEVFFECKLNIQTQKSSVFNVSLTGWRFDLLRLANRFLSSWVSPNAIIPSKLINTTSFKNFLQKGSKRKEYNYFLNERKCKSYIEMYHSSNKELSSKTGIPLQENYNYI